ncbi:hypothetical protein GRI75_12010 [Altererythrobacter soli]|uniref:Uncharacterized protein n=1 Tax=Croceibacterium soli TaxID=1739690 RepID=A0A6I4UWT9_9SPHN|nr:hypothetical protein [Croceibacterium soli]MXP42364.1 hypothetical protein [Croceibacterium soli]
MDSLTTSEPGTEPAETLLRDELAQGDATLSSAIPILRHLVLSEEQSLFSDEVVARVRGMLASMARQLLQAEAEAAQIADRPAFFARHEAVLAEALAGEPALLRHVHALTIEAQAALRLQSQADLDPVLSPLLQHLVAAEDGVVASTAMAALAAQARFIQHQRRMSLPIGELPAELFHKALLLFRAQAGDRTSAETAERTLRQGFDESLGRLALLSRLVMRAGERAPLALDVGEAGIAIFASALSLASGQERELTAMSFSEGQYARLALTMVAAGLPPHSVGKQFVLLHPDGTLPEGFTGLGSSQAARLLAASAPGREAAR